MFFVVISRSVDRESSDRQDLSVCGAILRVMADPFFERIAVIGSRGFDDYARLEAVLAPHLPAILVSGGAQHWRMDDTVTD